MKRDGPYHHGDLRNALIDAAAAIVEVRGLEELSLRGAARRAGVSQTAPYRHFADKEALIAAVAADGFLMLADDLRTAVTSGDLILVGKSYFRFAQDHPGRFQLMFGRDITDRQSHAELSEAEEELRSVLARLLGPDQVDALLSAFHGVTALSVAGLVSIKPDDLDGEAKLDQILEAVLGNLSKLG